MSPIAKAQETTQNERPRRCKSGSPDAGPFGSREKRDVVAIIGVVSSTLPHLYRTIQFGEPIVVVSGLPRSGTSMAMSMLEAGGLEVITDGVRQPDENNPRGYYEYERVKN